MSACDAKNVWIWNFGQYKYTRNHFVGGWAQPGPSEPPHNSLPPYV